MNSTQILSSLIKDEELQKYWSEINTDAIRIANLHSNSNTFLRLVAMHQVRQDESFSDRKIINHLNSFLK